MKVSSTGQPICPTGGTHKNPYERALICSVNTSKVSFRGESPRNQSSAAVDDCDAVTINRFLESIKGLQSLCSEVERKEEYLSLIEDNKYPVENTMNSGIKNSAPMLIPSNCIVSVPLRHSWKPYIRTLALNLILDVGEVRGRESKVNVKGLNPGGVILELFSR